MLEDGVDVEAEPVWTARDRAARAARFAGARLTAAGKSFRGAIGAAGRAAAAAVSPKAGRKPPAPAVAVPAVDEDWVAAVDPASGQTYWTNGALELAAWSDPRKDPGAMLYDARARGGSR